MTIIDRPDPTNSPSPEARIAELEATVARLAARLEQSETTPAEPASELPAGSRRNLFKLAAGAAAGGTALALSKAGPVAAADGDPINAGETVETSAASRATTVLKYANTETPQVTSLGLQVGANMMTVRDEPGIGILYNASSSSYPAALGGYSYTTNANGLYGYTAQDGFGVVGLGAGAGAAGLLARGSRANLELYPAGDAPADRIDAHVIGEMVADSTGELWYCTAAGSPGTWRKVAGSDTAGAFHPVTPFRVFDSREEGPDGLAGSSDQTVSVKDARDVETYAITQADAVPDGATAISANVVAIGTVGEGYATLNPGGDGSVGAAALNWTEGQTIGNAGIFKINAARELEVLVRGITNINMTIDVTGYWL